MITDNYLLDLIGRSKENAISKIEYDEFVYRIIKEDGIYYMMTMDHKPNRINLEIENDIIISANFG